MATDAYDSRGRLARVVSPGGTPQYGYDAIGRLSSVTGPSGTTEYGLDLAGNIVRVAAPNGVVTGQLFDARNRVTGVRHVRGTSTLGPSRTPSRRPAAA